MWEKAKSPWSTSLALSAAFVLFTVVANLIHGTYRHSVAERIFGDVGIWLIGACVVRLVIFAVGKFDGPRNP